METRIGPAVQVDLAVPARFVLAKMVGDLGDPI